MTRPRLQSRRRGGEDGGEQREVETGKERRRALRALKTIDWQITFESGWTKGEGLCGIRGAEEEDEEEDEEEEEEH